MLEMLLGPHLSWFRSGWCFGGGVFFFNTVEPSWRSGEEIQGARKRF